MLTLFSTSSLIIFLNWVTKPQNKCHFFTRNLASIHAYPQFICILHVHLHVLTLFAIMLQFKFATRWVCSFRKVLRARPQAGNKGLLVFNSCFTSVIKPFKCWSLMCWNVTQQEDDVSWVIKLNWLSNFSHTAVYKDSYHEPLVTSDPARL